MAAAVGCSSGPKSTKGGGGDTTPKPATGQKTIEQHMKELHEGADCDKQPTRVWCLAADGWAKGTAAPFPEGPHVMLGVSVTLLDDEPADSELDTTVALDVLASEGKGAALKGTIGDAEIAAADQQAMIKELAAVFKGKQDLAHLPDAVVDFLKPLPATAAHPFVKGAHGWTLEGAALATEIRKVGDYWVATETSASDPYGVMVLIFTDKLSAAK